MPPVPQKEPSRFTVFTGKTDAEKQRIRAARLAMFNAILKEALDG